MGSSDPGSCTVNASRAATATAQTCGPSLATTAATDNQPIGISRSASDIRSPGTRPRVTCPAATGLYGQCTSSVESAGTELGSWPATHPDLQHLAWRHGDRSDRASTQSTVAAALGALGIDRDRGHADRHGEVLLRSRIVEARRRCATAWIRSHRRGEAHRCSTVAIRSIGRDVCRTSDLGTLGIRLLKPKESEASKEEGVKVSHHLKCLYEFR
ncbi:MAG: hypothetical protein RLZZ519_1764 [Bacteroidota bacterium]